MLAQTPLSCIHANSATPIRNRSLLQARACSLTHSLSQHHKTSRDRKKIKIKKNALHFQWGYKKKELQKWDLVSDIRKAISKLWRVRPWNRLPFEITALPSLEDSESLENLGWGDTMFSLGEGMD